MDLGEKIRVLRHNKRVSQAQLAEALSVSAQSVSKWENALSAPDISLLPMLARYFGITMDELFGYPLSSRRRHSSRCSVRQALRHWNRRRGTPMKRD